MKKWRIVIGHICETDPKKDRFTWSGLIDKSREVIKMSDFEDCLDSFF